MLARFVLWSLVWFWGASLGPLLATAQSGSKAATISLLTCAPGAETYALFGHSALRVSDPERGLDQVYNYGTFDFDTPNFYGRFLRGDLRYFLSVTSFSTFLAAYQQQNRTVSEQVLALSPGEVTRVYQRLETTLHSPAKYYRYQFFANNCTTRLFDVVSTSVAVPLELDSTYVPAARTYRQLLAPYLAPAPWVKVGMNLGLGWPADRPVTFRQGLFLPAELQQAFAQATRRRQPFVAATRALYVAAPPLADPGGRWGTPTVVLVGLGALMLGATRLPPRWAFLDRGLRRSLFAVVGVTGCLLLGLQVFSLHTPAHFNYQLLWLLPTHVGLAVAQPRSGWRRYTRLALGLLVLGSLLGYGLYYAQLMPEIGWLLALLGGQLLRFRRQSVVASGTGAAAP